MASPIKNVVIAGASGTLGPHVLAALVDAGFSVTVLTRLDSKREFPDKTKAAPTDYTRESLLGALKGQDAVVDLIPVTNPAAHTALINAAAEVGVKRFFSSEFASNIDNALVSQRLFAFTKTMLSNREELKAQESSGMTWTGVINGPFFELGFQYGLFGLDPQKKVARFVDNGNAQFNTTTFKTIGRAVASILSDPTKLAATANKPVRLSSFRTTQEALLQVVLKVLGDKQEDWMIEYNSATDLAAAGGPKLAAGDMSGIFDLIKSVVFGEKDELGSYEGYGLANPELGLETEDLEDEVKKNLGLA